MQRLRPDPAQPPQAVLVLRGLLGESELPGRRRLYFTRELDYYAEFRDEDVLASDTVEPERAPFVGLEATTVTLRRDAAIEFTRTRKARPLDEFDIDVRLAPRGHAPGVFVIAGTAALTDCATCGADCRGDTNPAACGHTYWGCPTAGLSCGGGCGGGGGPTGGCTFTCGGCTATCESCHTCGTCYGRACF